MSTVTIVDPGPLSTLQDLGRPGWAHLGVSASGAADRGAHALANRLVGNPPEAATIEALFGGLTLRVDTAVTAAVTGAPAPVRVNDRPADHHTTLPLQPGDVLLLGVPDAGLRSYVALAGGIVVPPVLGSRAWDSLARLGPAPLSAGQVLPLGASVVDAVGVGHAPVRLPTLEPVTVGVWPGPRTDWLAGGLHALAEREWRVSVDSDRIGVRLDGTPLRRASAHEGAELPSEGVVRGAVQLPAGGLPVVFGSDHPVTGGYPVVAVLPAPDADLLAQARPGQAVRFTPRRGPSR
ncbi:MAG: biotin-dependent carboxyltransferase family protein [Propionibacteriaceae bacterium]|nr:biotin-dependent carboxyltransferase family protein [Propionibacteriaceae bacterium]